jgi:hypothetical protein
MRTDGHFPPIAHVFLVPINYEYFKTRTTIKNNIALTREIKPLTSQVVAPVLTMNQSAFFRQSKFTCKVLYDCQIKLRLFS